MKKVFCLIFVAFSLFFLSKDAKAVTITDFWVPGSFLMTSPTSYGYTHDINDNGYNPLTDTITSVTLRILLDDDWSPLIRDGLDTGVPFVGGPIYEYADIYFEGGSSLNNEVDHLDLYTFNIAPSYLTDGLLNVSINATRGDFKFLGSQLVVKTCQKDPVAPEPATLSLLGLGILAIIGLKQNKKRGNI